MGYARPEADGPRTLGLTEAGWRVLKGKENVTLRKDTLQIAETRKTSARGANASPEIGAGDKALLDALKDLRKRIASERDVPAYVVFSDRTLIEIATKKPRDTDSMRGIHGVGERKLRDFAPAFVDTVREHTGG